MQSGNISGKTMMSNHIIQLTNLLVGDFQSKLLAPNKSENVIETRASSATGKVVRCYESILNFT
jgi:hypothetical protein